MTSTKTAGRIKAAPVLPSRVMVRLELTPDGKQQVAAVAGHFGRTQIASLSRLVEWFAGQTEAVQAAILGGAEGTAGADVVRRILESVARSAASPRA